MRKREQLQAFKDALLGEIETAAGAPILGGFTSRVLGLGPQIGYIFPIGNMQGYLNLKHTY
jgi:hypothetical protein